VDQAAEIKDAVKAFILEEFLPGEDPGELRDDTPLITGGVLDSIATLKLVAYVEESYGIELEPYEADAEHLNTLLAITSLVQSKLADLR
jgi:acyl carrier protein